MVVLDAFCGSATTMVACKNLGLNYIGFELDEHWWKVGNERLQGMDQNGNINLFDI